MLWFLAFVLNFTIGGMTGVLMSIAPADFQVHNSLFLIAHFHSMIIGGVLFGFFAGFTYWFPKITGFKLNERIGKYAFWCWVIGFSLAFFPLYALGLMGVTRRLDHYEAGQGWTPLFVVAAIGALFIGLGMMLQFLQIIWSIIHRKHNRDTTGDPWNGRTLEWATPSPPPFYNFPFTPKVHDRDAFWAMKEKGEPKGKKPVYHDIHMPKSTSVGFWIGVLSFFFGFGMIWAIWWLVLLSALGIIIFTIVRLSSDDTDYYVSAEEVEKIEESKTYRKGFTWQST